MSYPLTRRRYFTRAPKPARLFLTIITITGLSVLPFLVRGLAKSAAHQAITNQQPPYEPARLSESISVHAAGRGNPTINLSDGHDLVTSYSGPAELRAALEQNLAEPRGLASADFDEDGVPDLVSGYGYGGRGIVTLLRGNVDSIYPNAPEAGQRRANGTSTDAPFLSPAQIFESPVAADFIGAGDFDGDSHWDVVVASRLSKSLDLFAGDGHGGFAPARQVLLSGVVTAMTTGEVNRRDGLTDIIVGLTNEGRSQLLVYEGPNGALNADPERFVMRAEVGSVALGQLDWSDAIDLAVSAGNELIVVAGRDRKLSLDATQQAKVSPAALSHRVFDSRIRSMTLGDFTGSNLTDVVLLMDSGEAQVLSQVEVGAKPAALRTIETWRAVSFPIAAISPANLLVATHTSGSAHDDLLIADVANSQLHILTSGDSDGASMAAAENRPSVTAAPLHLSASLDVIGGPVAVLPMRLNTDSLSDLMVLTSKQNTPAAVMNQPQATFVVLNTNPTGAGSLQFAILDANETPGADLITFNIPGTGPFIINVTAALPTITDTVTIDATTQPGFAGTPIIQLNGNQAGKGPNGFVLSASNCVVRGMAISGFDYNPNQFDPVTGDGGGAGVSVRSNNNLIEGNGFGLTPFMYAGVRAVGPASNNTIGGTTAAARNVMVTVFLAVLLPQTANNNKVQGNLIGGGRVAIGDQTGGAGGTSNIIGGTVAGARNVINKGGQVRISGNGSSGSGNLVQGNYIGTDESGNAATPLPGGGGEDGVKLDPLVGGNTVGGTTAAARNVISANGLAGVRAGTGNCLTCNNDLNLVQGNFIGTKADGTGDLGNTQQGVVVEGINLFNIAVGGTAAGAGNIISNNKQTGVEINGTGIHVLQGNLIGTDISGNVDSGNVQNGVYIHNSPNNVIGGTDPAARNVISGNGLSGVLIEGPQSTGNVVLGNFIGTNASGTGALGNDLNGVTTSAAPGNTIGGSVVEARNIISANARHGVSIGIDTNSGSTGITVRNNYIGTDVTGSACLGNQRDGVFVNRGSVSHTIADNLITCNQRNGVNIPNFATNDPGIRIEVTSNSIYANAALGIDLGDAGITANDPQDPDGGANFQQNFPVLGSFAASPLIESAGSTGEMVESGDNPQRRRPDSPAVTVTVNGTLNSTPNSTFTLHWYFSNDAQCVTNQQTSRPLVTGRIPGVTTDSSGNASFNFPLDFPVGVANGIINSTATDSLGNTSEFSSCLPVNSTPPPTVKLSASSYNAGEAAGSVGVTVQRSGDTSAASTINYATSDSAGANNCNVVNSGNASSRCDYETTAGTLRFAAGETSKTLNILLINDTYAEGNETFTIALRDPVNATVGSPSTATVTITDNDSVNAANPIDQSGFFVNEHYLDFLNRQPDSGGLGYWTNEITSCGSNAACIDIKRINVSAAFYLSIEFQETGYLVERLYKAAYGDVDALSALDTYPSQHSIKVPIVRFEEFLPDSQQISNGVIVGQAGWPEALEANKQAFVAQFVQRPRSITALPASLTPAQFVDKLNTNAGNPLDTTERNQLVNDLTSSAKTRAQVLRAVAEDATLVTAETNRAFVLMQYFGYLRRTPNDAPDIDYTGFDFWLHKLNQFNGNFVNAEMVKAFISSIEYRQRFGP